MLPLMALATESKVSAHYLQHTSSLVRVIRRGLKRQSPLLKLLEGHTGYVYSVDFSPDGSLIVSGSDDGTVRIWDTERGVPAGGPFEAHVGRIKSVTFLSDGTHIIVCGYKGISVLDAESGSTIVGSFKKCISSVAVSPNGKHIVAASSHVVNMWDLESRTIVGEPFIGHTDVVQCIAYSRDGRFIASGSDDKSVRVWDVESRRLIREPFLGRANRVYSVNFSPDGKCIVSGSNNDTVKISRL